MLSRDAFELILGIKEKTELTLEEMANNLNVTFFPNGNKKLSKNVVSFSRELEEVLNEIGVNIVPFDDSLIKVSFSQIFKKFFKIVLNNLNYIIKKNTKNKVSNIYIDWSVIKNLLKRDCIKPGISIITLGEGADYELPIDITASFTKNLIVTILDKPAHIKDDSDFHEHFDTALDLFAKHMTNIVIAVDNNSWLLYNFNASHPTYKRGNDFKKNVLDSLISKIAAPMQPQKLSDFNILKRHFDVETDFYKDFIDDMVESGKLLEKIGLYPKGKKIDLLPFRNNFYKWIGKIHLDDRNGMSYGFLAWQLPTVLSKLSPISSLDTKYKDKIVEKDYFYDNSGNLFIVIHLPQKGDFYMKVPEVWVLTQRSGCDKTNFVPQEDLLKMGLLSGRMYLEMPTNAIISKNYKPSFDTKVILAHSVGNAIVASIQAFLSPNASFYKQVRDNGVALSHWHGYLDPEKIPNGWYVHGHLNPHVACSTPQSAIYAISGKLNAYMSSIDKKNVEFLGDVHIEPHHGTNINFISLQSLAKFLYTDIKIVSLGNKYLSQYDMIK